MEHYLKKELYELIKEKDAIFDFLMSGSLDGLWYWDLENPEEEWMNPRFWEVLGYDPNVMPHKVSAWQDIINPDDLQVAIENFNKHVADPQHPYDQEVRYTHKNGSTVWVRCRGLAIRDDEGKAIRMLGVHQDITALKESEEHYRLIVENSLQGIVIAQNDPIRLSYVSPPMQTITGYTVKELLSFTHKELKELIYPDDRKRFFDSFVGRIRGDHIPSQSEYRIIHKTGTIRWVELFSSKITYQNEPATQTAFIDITERKKTKLKLEQSNNLFEQVIANITSIVWQADIAEDGSFTNTYISPIADTLLELEPGTIGNSWEKYFQRIKPEYIDRVNDAFKKAIQTPGFLISMEYQVVKGNNEIVWFYSKGRCLQLDGRLIAIGSTSDITERKNTELALMNSEEKFRAISEHAPVLINSFDENGKCVLWNKACEKILGYTIDEINEVDDSFALFYPDAHIRSEVMRTVVDPDSKFREWNPITKNGKELSMLWANFKITDNHTISLGYDITEQKLAEEQIKKSEKHLRSLVENPAGYVVYRTRFNRDTEKIDVIQVSPTFMDILGVSKEDMNVFSKWFSYVYPEDLEAMLVANQTGMLPPFKLFIEVRYLHPQKGLRWLEIRSNGIPYEDDPSMIEYANGMILDITERKQAEYNLMKAKEKAEESDRLKSAFLANMGHEIRTPMNGILGFTSLLENPDLSEETREQYIQIIKKSGDRMLDTVNNLISISKIETGQEELHLKEVNPCVLINEIYEFFKPAAEAKGIEIVLGQRCEDKALIDSNKFNSIVSNLIKNAIKFTDTGSIYISNKIDDIKLTLVVKDTGQGIPLDRQEAIFDRFVQADLNDVKALQGSGLGLSIVKAYVDMMGGSIKLESELDKGSCFTIELPIVKAGNVKQENKSTVQNLTQKTFKKILIAEDDEISFMHLSINMEKYAEEILHAYDGEEAIELARKNPDIDVILMDIKMPCLNGLDATKKIREFNKDVLIIAQTAYAMVEDEQKAITAGCNAYISKPINIDALLKLVSK